MIPSPRGALLGDTIVGEEFREGTKGLLAAVATTFSSFLERSNDVMEFSTLTKRNTIPHFHPACRLKPSYDAPSMSVKRACDWSVTAPRRAVRVSEARMGLVNGRDGLPSRSRNSCPALQ